MKTVQISIVIPTYKRPGPLKRILQNLAQIEVPSSLAWEIIVVNNDPQHDMSALIESYRGQLPLSYVREKKLGKSYALNRGIDEARGTWLAFLDDDVVVDKRWLLEVIKGIERYRQASFFGGRIVGEFPKGILSWLDPGQIPAWMKGFLVDYNYGSEDRIFDLSSMDAFYGAHLLVRRDWLKENGGFNIEIGPLGREKRFGEDEEIVRRLVGSGETGHYLGRAIVHHVTTPDRMRPDKIYEYFAGTGHAQARLAFKTIRAMSDQEFLMQIVVAALNNIMRVCSGYDASKKVGRAQVFQCKADMIKRSAALSEELRIRHQATIPSELVRKASLNGYYQKLSRYLNNIHLIRSRYFQWLQLAKKMVKGCAAGGQFQDGKYRNYLMIESAQKHYRQKGMVRYCLMHRKMDCPIFVIATNQVGSDLLLSYLKAIPGAYFLNEIFNPDKEHGLPLMFQSKEAALRHIGYSMSYSRSTCYGVEILSHHLETTHLSVEDLKAAYPGAQYIVVYRKNLSDQFISWRIAEETQIWDLSKVPETIKINFDLKDYKDFVEYIRIFYDNVLKTLRFDRVAVINYEELISDPQGVFDNKIFTLLGVPTVRIDRDSDKEKMLSLLDRVSNAEQVKEWLESHHGYQYYEL